MASMLYIFYYPGTLRRATVSVFFAIGVFTVWTTYNAYSNNLLHVRKKIYKTEEGTIVKKSPEDNRVTLVNNKLNSENNSISSSTSQPPPTLFLNNSSDILAVYKKKWVGFPEMYGSNCNLTFNSTTANNTLFPPKVKRIHPAQITADGSDCTVFIEKYGYGRYPAASQEELEFPLAFLILFNKDLDQVLFLLRAIYHPHNAYCLSIDSKSSIEFLEAVQSVIKCLPNVFMASKLENVVYAGFSRLMTDIHCMNDLMKHPVQWKYAINMPGQQFPLRTNLEMVRILRKFNGANDIEGITGGRMLPARYQFKHVYPTDNNSGQISLIRTAVKHDPPPHDFQVVKGSAYGTFSRAFVQFVVSSREAKDLLEWARFISSPDEYYWAILHHSQNVSVPGRYTAGKPDDKPWLTSYASWGNPCTTIHVRGVCIFSPTDLPNLMQRYELFANKFYITHHPGALHCLDQLIFNLTFTGSTRNLTFYDSLPFILKAR